jgi:pyruvate dehydrogenase E2 component (dihydrolipoamide acetyltransferase)
MISEVVMPQMGADMTEGTLLRWLKQEGDAVTRGDVIAEIETDKANVEIEAFDGGVFRTALAHEGDVVQVGEVIAVIAAPDDDISKYGSANGPAQSQQTASGKQPSPMPARPADAPDGGAQTLLPAKPGAPPPPADGRVRASPLAKKVAGERGIDLRSLRGSGPGGRIVRKDVEAFAPSAEAPSTPGRARRAAPSTADVTIAPSKMRQAIARRMSQSKREAPHYYLLIDIDMTDAMAFRAQLNEAVGEAAKVSINDLIVRASALALQRHPAFNATIDGDRVTQHGEQHVCIGVALDDGLIAPAIVGAGRMALVEIAAAARDLTERAKRGSLRPDEMSAGTFTISNLGAYGIETLIAIIQPPQTAILGVGSVMAQPAVRGGAVTARQMMKLALSADHRVTDGAQGARFLSEIKRLLEQPLLLIL